MAYNTLEDLPSPPEGKTGWPWTETYSSLAETSQEGDSWPRVSIVTPTYNQDRFIEETIRSVLLQGYPNLEYIIVDRESTDQTIDILEKYDPWVDDWVCEPNRGQAHAVEKEI
jgi:cellulose synthase/poly-beta-1,6-N-acetylglucosamine synthase-like glycosyltransferase